MSAKHFRGGSLLELMASLSFLTPTLTTCGRYDVGEDPADQKDLDADDNPLVGSIFRTKQGQNPRVTTSSDFQHGAMALLGPGAGEGAQKQRVWRQRQADCIITSGGC